MKRLNLFCLLALVALFSCGKDDDISKNGISKEDYLHTWSNTKGVVCPNSAITFTLSEEGELMAHGVVAVAFNEDDGSFEGDVNQVTHYGSLNESKDTLTYCQKAYGVDCCSEFVVGE